MKLRPCRIALPSAAFHPWDLRWIFTFDRHTSHDEIWAIYLRWREWLYGLGYSVPEVCDVTQSGVFKL